jgi:hypothetical protein
MALTATTPPLLPLWHQFTWWTLAFPVAMIVAIARHDIFLLNWIHVLSGTLWTGADLFMGFILGPAFRMLDMRARTAQLLTHAVQPRAYEGLNVISFIRS